MTPLGGIIYILPLHWNNDFNFLKEMEKRLLLIIDPQIDFITGTLPVPGAEQAMDKLSDYVRQKGTQYERVVVTADYHPISHISFKSNGGNWPCHCIADSVGAAIWPTLMTSFFYYPEKIKILHKGNNPNKEEYSIFKNQDSGEELINIIKQQNIDIIDVCGLSGDVCVLDTIKDMLSLIDKVKINVLKEFTSSIDGGEALNSIIENKNLSCDQL